jgi:hypothetical protein
MLPRLESPPRRSLSGKNACGYLFFIICDYAVQNANERRRMTGSYDLAADISQRCRKNEIDPTAWRVSARKWMEHKRMIVHP